MKNKSKQSKKIKDDIASNQKSASAATGYKIELVKALCERCHNITTSGGRIVISRLKEAAEKFPDIVEARENIPDIKLEKALLARIERREGEVRLETPLQNIAPIDICRRILIRGGGALRSKLMSIPDRVSEWCALQIESGEPDKAQKIRERLITELTEALESISQEPVEKLIEKILKDAA